MKLTDSGSVRLGKLLQVEYAYLRVISSTPSVSYSAAKGKIVTLS
jgi:hypothetical protein